MSMEPVAIYGGGLVSGIGLTMESTCAAMRCAIDNFTETRYMDAGGEWTIGSSVPFSQPWRGRVKLIKMLAAAIDEAFQKYTELNAEDTPLILCLPEKSRIGRLIDNDQNFYEELCHELGVRFHRHSVIVAEGKVSIATALETASQFINRDNFDSVMVASVDSMLVNATLSDLEESERLLSSNNSNGVIPGEAAAALVLRKIDRNRPSQLCCLGCGHGVEAAPVGSGLPLRADGLVDAIRQALSKSRYTMFDLDFRVTDCAGEQYYFKEASLALTRLLKKKKEEYDIWHPADCTGDIGTAMGPVMVLMLFMAIKKNYDKGRRALLHLGNHDGRRVAMVFEQVN